MGLSVESERGSASAAPVTVVHPSLPVFIATGKTAERSEEPINDDGDEVELPAEVAVDLDEEEVVVADLTSATCFTAAGLGVAVELSLDDLLGQERLNRRYGECAPCGVGKAMTTEAKITKKTSALKAYMVIAEK